MTKIKSFFKAAGWEVFMLVLALVNFVLFITANDNDPDKIFALINFWGLLLSVGVNTAIDAIRSIRTDAATRPINLYVTRDEFEKIVKQDGNL